MSAEHSSYRQIFKATSLFGGVQVLNIIIAIIRSKIIAVLLGPTGMGISGLLNSTTQLIRGLTSFGLETSAVKNVASAYANSDKKRISVVVGVLRRLVWITGLLGLLITIILAPWLSQITFGNRDYSIAFIWLSVTLLLYQISAGQGVLLRGMRQLKFIARSSVLGSLMGLLVSVPIYYFFRLDGIVPAMILSSSIALVLTWYYSAKVKIIPTKIDKEVITSEARDMLTMGFMLSLSSIITMGSSYLIRIYISNTGGVDQVGMYTAGFAIINSYIGMVFTAMSTDYFPRLSGIAHDNKEVAKLINQQSEIAILILAPLLAVFIIFIRYVVVVFYSSAFAPINEMIQWAALGIYFKASSWTIAFVMLAKGAKKTFLMSEVISNVYVLGLNVLGYRLAGLEGLGMSFLVAYFLYLIQVLAIATYKYEFAFNSDYLKVGGFQILIGLLCFTVMKVLSPPWTFILGIPLIIISISYSLRELDRRFSFRSLVMSKINHENERT